jgi:hypothetical protein
VEDRLMPNRTTDLAYPKGFFDGEYNHLMFTDRWGAELRYRIWNGSEVQGPRTIHSLVSTSHQRPVVAHGGDGNIVIAWCDDHEGLSHVYVMISTDNGGSFGDVVRVDAYTKRPPESAPSVLLDDSGGIHIVWLEEVSSSQVRLAYSYSADLDPNFTVPSTVVESVDVSFISPRLLATKDGEIELIFIEDSNEFGADSARLMRLGAGRRFQHQSRLLFPDARVYDFAATPMFGGGFLVAIHVSDYSEERWSFIEWDGTDGDVNKYPHLNYSMDSIKGIYALIELPNLDAALIMCGIHKDLSGYLLFIVPSSRSTVKGPYLPRFGWDNSTWSSGHSADIWWDGEKLVTTWPSNAENGLHQERDIWQAYFDIGFMEFSNPRLIGRYDWKSPKLVDFHATSGPSNTTYLAWAADWGSQNTICFARSPDGGKTLTTPLNITHSHELIEYVDIAARDELVCVLWSEMLGYWNKRIYSITSTDGGRTFASPVRIAASAYIAPKTRIFIDPSDVIHILWFTKNDSAQLQHMTSDDSGLTFSLEPPFHLPRTNFEYLMLLGLTGDEVGNLYCTVFNRTTTGGSWAAWYVELHQLIAESGNTYRLSEVVAFEYPDNWLLPQADMLWDSSGTLHIVWNQPSVSGSRNVLFRYLVHSPDGEADHWKSTLFDPGVLFGPGFYHHPALFRAVGGDVLLGWQGGNYTGASEPSLMIIRNGFFIGPIGGEDEDEFIRIDIPLDPMYDVEDTDDLRALRMHSTDLVRGPYPCPIVALFAQKGRDLEFQGLVIRPNLLPDEPSPLSPLGDELVVGPEFTMACTSVIDPDGDPIEYMFEILDESGNVSLRSSGLHEPSFKAIIHESGRYSWRVRIRDGYGELVSSWIVSFDFNSGPPYISTGGPYQSFEGVPVHLDASLSSDPDGITLFQWDIDGDGIYDLNETGPYCIFTYEDDIIVAITLRVVDTDGLDSMETTIAIIKNRPPEANVTTPDEGSEGVPVDFRCEAWDPGPSDEVMVIWELGDGHQATGANISHAYDDDGTYEGLALVYDDDGGYYRFPFTVTIRNLPPDIEGLPEYIETDEGTLMKLEPNISDPGPVDRIAAVWLLDGVQHSTDRIFSWEPQIPGEYSVILQVSDGDGGEVEACCIIHVKNIMRPVELLDVKALTEHSIKVKWAPTEEESFRFYRIIVSEDYSLTGNRTVMVKDASTTEKTVEGLSSARTYFVAIELVTEEGRVLSNILSTTTPESQSRISENTPFLIFIVLMVIIIVIAMSYRYRIIPSRKSK